MKNRIIKLSIISISCIFLLGINGCSSKEVLNISKDNSDEEFEEYLEAEKYLETTDIHTADSSSSNGTYVDTTIRSVDNQIYMSQNMYVYVCGEVVKPGVYELPSGSRVYEAIDMAGGMTEDAATDMVNQALPVEDGMQITIPGEGDMLKRQQEIEEAGLININTATLQELMTLKGIGESRAQAIIDYREEQGSFTAIEDIMQVPGIKQGAFDKIKDSIVVG